MLRLLRIIVLVLLLWLRTLGGFPFKDYSFAELEKFAKGLNGPFAHTTPASVLLGTNVAVSGESKCSPSVVRVTRRLTYSQLDEILATDSSGLPLPPDAGRGADAAGGGAELWLRRSTATATLASPASARPSCALPLGARLVP